MSSLDKLEPYAGYKDSGLAWVGKVPKAWEVRKLSNFGKTFGGGTPSTENPDYWGGNIVWATPKDLSAATNEYLYDSSRKITSLGQQHASILIPANSILFGCRAPVGNVAISGVELTTNQGFISLIPNEKNLTRFIFFLLNATKKEIQNESSGTTFQEISRSKLQNLKFPQPPLETQQRIVDYLDKETVRIDNTVGEMRTLVNLLQEKRKVLISEVVTKGIPGEHTEFKDSGVEWLGDVPVAWSIGKISRHFRERREIVSDKDYAPLSVTKNGILPQLSNAAKTDNGDSRKKVLTGDFVINSRSDRKGSSGVSPLDGSVSLISTVLTPKSTINNKYIHEVLRSRDFQEEYYRHGKGIVADLWTTRSDAMGRIIIPVPDFEEQQRIAAYLDEETSKIDTLIKETEKAIELLQEERKALIREVVTGQLEV